MAANPYLTAEDNPTMATSAPVQTHPLASNLEEYAATPFHVALLLGLALFFLAAMKASGFRAMVGIGRS